MDAKHKEFFEKLGRLCEEYNATIQDSGSIRKGIEVAFPNEYGETVYEKLRSDPHLLTVMDENGDEHLYK